ncbi:relaxase/mobilization nuclease domain-containing protein [Flavonifractor sp. An9]|uniref:relaxase/mobilization nuclease domain-containing protein n=1 Tax=Flavonifractor sp. An9 TaxID=1965664 RepID=UPI0013021A4A|nr:relaxase/mobilization nuclease domain-containing protein [Flavonifractor sp. An9]
MGITKIKAVKDSLSRIVGYAENPEKTHYSDMQQVLHYADNQEKVSMEQTMYVTGLHCRREQAYEDMMYTKRHFNKTGGNVAYHCIQSFKTGEVTPELCHQLGVELAQRMWGDRFQVLVATHFNTGTYHNHLVINSVSYKDGKKFNCNQKAFYQMREISDQLCREHNLTVIEHPSGKTPRNIYFAEKQGKPTTFGLMRQAIDEAVGISWSWFDFCQVMKEKGYLINASPHRKYATIRAIGAKKAVRMVRLGEEYDHRRIIQRIDTMDYREKEACGRAYQQVRRRLSQPPKRMRMAGNFHSVKKITGLKALYLHYCYFLGIFPRKGRTRPLSPSMRLEVTKLEQLSRQIELIHREHLNSVQDVEGFLISVQSQIEEKLQQRTGIYHKLRRCQPGEQMDGLKEQRAALTRELSTLRRQQATAKRLLAQLPEKKRQILLEQKMRRSHRQSHKNKKRRIEYER